MMGRRIGQLAGAACFLVLTMGPMGAIAQGDKASAADKKFVKEAMQGGMAEVELGQLATQKAQSSDVKQFGQKMVDDHTKLNDQMKPVASQLGITPPASLDMKHKAVSTKLNKLSGDEFDKAYIKAMVKDHQKDVAEFQKEASTGSSA
jgi:putative membrane protein